MPLQEGDFSTGLDSDLTERIRSGYIREGRLFGAVLQADLNDNERRQLDSTGWIARNYHDRPVVEPPQATFDWEVLRAAHRDRTLHAVSHQLPTGVPWAGTRQAILEELLASRWEQQEEHLRLLLHAWAYASVWSSPAEAGKNRPESAEIFFFYTQRMKEAAEQAVLQSTAAPDHQDEFWDMVSALALHTEKDLQT
ncbi:MAG: hypothetical protein M0Z53_12205 [Thermaerobacter sp.]|nr:hypothetical protein [Thermaerobacter sp.]